MLSSQPVDVDPHAGELVRVAGTPDMSTSASLKMSMMSDDQLVSSCNRSEQRRVLLGKRDCSCS